MGEWEHGLYYFNPKEMEMGTLKYPNQKLFFHDLLTHWQWHDVAGPWTEMEMEELGIVGGDNNGVAVVRIRWRDGEGGEGAAVRFRSRSFFTFLLLCAAVRD